MILALVALGAFQTVNAFAKNNKTEKEVIKMGESYGRDSAGVSGRSFDKKLVIAKGSWNVGLDFLYLGLNSSNSEILMLVTGMTTHSSLLRVAPSVAWSFANNNVIGVKALYSNTNIILDNANVSLLSDDLKFSMSNIDTRMQSYGAGVYERTYFGLDKRGIFSIFLEFMLGYKYTRTDSGSAYANTNSINLSFNPGFEVFVLNNLSLQLCIGLADIGYNWSRSFDGNVEGTSDSFKANAQFNLANMDFGLKFYF